ncbi:DnaJ family domain-containing protein [Herpetosiphon llansteffanensis]
MSDNPFLDRFREQSRTVGKTKPQTPTSETPSEEEKPKRGPSLTAQRAGSIAEQRIQAAMEDGMFNNLPGEGQPIDLNDDMYIPSEMRMAFRVMKGNQAGSPWGAAQHDYNNHMNRYQIWLRNNRETWATTSFNEQERLRQELHIWVRDLNTIIHQLNAMVPNDTLRVGLVVYERELRALESAL